MSSYGRLIVLLLVAACDASGRLAEPPALSSDRVGPSTTVVHPGESIQAAVNAARPGDVIAIEPGLWDGELGGVTFEDLVVVTEDGCELLTDFPYDLKPS